jgi:hypothetical protein
MTSQFDHDAAMEAGRKAFCAAATNADWHDAMCRAYHAHLAPLVRAEAFKSGAEAMREAAARIAEYARLDTRVKICRANEDNHQSELNHQEGRWHAANDIEKDIRDLPIPLMEPNT